MRIISPRLVCLSSDVHREQWQDHSPHKAWDPSRRHQFLQEIGELPCPKVLTAQIGKRDLRKCSSIIHYIDKDCKALGRKPPTGPHRVIKRGRWGYKCELPYVSVFYIIPCHMEFIAFIDFVEKHGMSI